MAIEIVDLPINSMVIFHSFLYVYQRVMRVKTNAMFTTHFPGNGLYMFIYIYIPAIKMVMTGGWCVQMALFYIAKTHGFRWRFPLQPLDYGARFGPDGPR